MKKKKIYWEFMALCLYVAITSIVGRFQNPELTETELLLQIPNFAVWQF